MHALSCDYCGEDRVQEDRLLPARAPKTREFPILAMNKKARILRLALPCLATIGLLIGAETALRVKRGPPPPDRVWPDFDFYYSDIYKKFFKLAADPSTGGRIYVTNRPRAAHQQFIAEKPLGLVRIFVVGGSVSIAYAGEARVRLLKFLSQAFPGRKFEVIGCGMGGYDSYRDSMVQKEILDYHPDAVVLMSGNNEYYEPETANPTLYHLTSRLRKLWVFRLALDLQEQRHPYPTTLRDRLAIFEANLRLMAERAKQKNVPMIFCTLPANIRDTPPLRSLPPLGDTDYLAARAALDAGDDLAASQKFERYVHTHPDEPFGHYWLAKTLDRRKLYSEARKHYLLALDLDDPGARCSTARNEIIRRVAKETGMILADLDTAFNGIAEQRIPDGRIFVDGCHWRGEYYPLASWVILRSIYDSSRSGGMLLSPAGAWDWDWFETEKAEILKPTLGRKSLNAYGDEAVYKAMNTASWEYGRLSEGALALLERAVTRDPERLDYLAGSFEHLRPAFEKYMWLNDNANQMRERWSDISINVGEAYRRQRNFPKALAYFDGVLRREPGLDLALLLRAKTLASLGRLREAKLSLARLSTTSRNLPEFAYWRRKMGVD